ncbi:MAG: hypothetical protein QNJ97_13640 [Myxococcota bacterium]|nr:hypothetical protein [Myxococcota bacterium]
MRRDTGIPNVVRLCWLREATVGSSTSKHNNRTLKPSIVRRVGQVLLILISLAHFTRALAAPTLTYHDEFTHTGDVRDILITEDFVWLATSGGLAAHDPSGAFRFKLTSKDGLPCNSLRAVLPQKDGSLLAVGDFGWAVVGRVEESGEIGVILSHDRKQDNVYDPFVAAKTWKGQPHLLGFQSGLRRFADALHATPYPQGAMYSALAVSGSRAALGGLDGRLVVLNHAQEVVTSLTLNHPILGLAFVNRGWLIAAGDGLFLLEHGRIEPIPYRKGVDSPLSIIATSLTETDDDKILVGTHTGDVYQFQDGDLTHLTKIEEKRITALAKHGKHLFIGYENEGLYRVDPSASKSSGPLRPTGEICSNHVTQMTRHNGFNVVGTFDRGACHLKGDTWQPIHGLRSPYVHGVASDGTHLWVASSNGLDRFDSHFEPAPIGEGDPNNLKWFSETACISAVERGQGRIAISSAYGVMLIKSGEKGFKTKFINRREGVPSHITKIDAASGELFIASETQGVKALGLGSHIATTYLDPVHLPEAWVMDVSAWSADEFWVATCQNGVAYIKNGSGFVIQKQDGLPDDRIIRVAAQKDGAFIGTLGGLAFISTDGEVSNYAKAINTPDPRTSLVHSEGKRLWYGTESGLVVYTVR